MGHYASEMNDPTPRNYGMDEWQRKTNEAMKGPPDPNSLAAKDGEIARLRAALMSLTEDPPATLDEPDTDAEVIVKMRAIAREALDHGLPTAEDVRGILALPNGDRQ